MPTIQELTTKLNQALHLKEQIESLQEKLDVLLGGSSTTTKTKRKVGRLAGKVGRPAKVKRTISVAHRAALAAGQKARWAKINGKSSTKKPTTAKASPAKAAPSQIVREGSTQEKGDVTGSQGEDCSGDESTLGSEEEKCPFNVTDVRGYKFNLVLERIYAAFSSREAKFNATKNVSTLTPVLSLNCFR